MNIMPFIIVLAVYVMSILFHEIAHAVYFSNILSKQVAISFYYDNWHSWGIKVGNEDDYNNLSDKNYMWLNYYAVITGYLTILFFTVALKESLCLLLVFPYTAGAWQDITEVYKAWRYKNVAA